MSWKQSVLCTVLLVIPALTDQILENDIVEVECYRGDDETCTGESGMRMAFDLCCDCFRWSYEGDVSSTKKGQYTLGDSDFKWVSHITNENCDPNGRTANKHADAGCVQQQEGKTYRCKIHKIIHRNETCSDVTPVCEQGPYPGDTYVSLEESGGPQGGGATGGASKGGGKGGGSSVELPTCPSGQTLQCKDGTAPSNARPPCSALPLQCCDDQNGCTDMQKPGGLAATPGSTAASTSGSGLTWGVWVKDSTCAGNPGSSGTLSHALDADGCSGGWDRGGGNYNSYKITNCSSKCVCAIQFAGTKNCKNAIGSSVKESCLDSCGGDCNGPNCQDGKDKCTSEHCVYDHTFLKLLDEPIKCDNMQSDDEYECDTTGMDPDYVSPHARSSATPMSSISTSQSKASTLAQPKEADGSAMQSTWFSVAWFLILAPAVLL